MSQLDQIVKAYDIRGTVPDQFDAGHRSRDWASRSLGSPGSSVVLVGRDMRPSGTELAEAFAQGLMEQGVDVVDLGLASTDLVYFAAGKPRCACRDVHRVAQPGPVQRREVVPLGCEARR